MAHLRDPAEVKKCLQPPVQPVKGEDTVGPSLLVLFDSSGPMKTDEPYGWGLY